METWETKYPHVAAYLKCTGMTLDEAIAYFEQLEDKEKN